MDKDKEDTEEGVVCELCNDTGIMETYGETDFGDWEKTGEKRCPCTEN